MTPTTHVEHDERVMEEPSGIRQQERVIQDPSTGYEHREQILQDFAAERRLWLYRITQLIWTVVGLIDAMIGLRVLLKLIGANPNNAFADFVYRFSALFLGPFFGLIENPSTDGMILEISSLIGMAVYALGAWGLVSVASMMFERVGTRSISTRDRYRT